ncbi:hypothetical protein CN090_04160 [Sinorhizobium meliloti]|uniref:hypothetical protein n=1 Tax=Rhizobium meliloti TaxID=382 RepID=UPI000FD7A617|nr:hypothetical protein [Sinorhizobium meliloti]RVO55121.1 hypothetical protein CN090_04160 [Sinorhizobium meliloti]
MTEQPYQKFSRIRREKLEAALALPLPASVDDIGVEGFFDPWRHVINGIDGSYSSESDDLMIEVLEAVRDGTTFELIKSRGFIVEFMLYVLSGHDLTECGTSPRGSWPDQLDLWQPLIDKWKAYREVAWS